MRARLNRTLNALDETSAAAWFIGVMAFALLERIAMWLLYQPTAYGDTNSYWRLAEGVRGGLKDYDATRTPGYPALLALFDTPEKVWQVQTVMGLVITVLLFYAGWQVTRRGWMGGLAALAHCFNMGQLFFEPNILSETASTFWIMLSFAGLVVWMYRPRFRQGLWGILLGLALGVSVSMAWMTRTLFVYLPFWMLLFLAGVRYSDRGALSAPRRLPASVRLPVLSYLLPVLLVLGSWVGWMKVHYGDWALTTMTGYHMIQHTGVFFEYAPDKYADLREVYLKYRDQQIAEHGSPANAIWDAIPEMEKVSGLSFFDLSRVLARISKQMILEHPDLYLRNVVEGWWSFWWAPVYWQSESVRWEGFVPVIRGLVLVSRLAVFGANLLFLASTVAAVLWKGLRKRISLSPVLWLMASSVWIASILQTLADHGDNPRFLVPLQPLAVLWVLYFGYELVRSYAVGPEWRRVTAAAVRSM